MKTDLSKSVIYQIYPRTFTADGTIKAAQALIPHLHNLGIDIIYMSAINKADDSPTGHSPRQIASGFNNPKNPYRIIDYYEVDEEYGAMEDLKSFIDTAHRYNIKVLIDLVYLHFGPKAVFLNEHPDFAIRDENGEIKEGDVWPFPRFNLENTEVREYLYKNMEFYIGDIKADGFRCDSGDYLPLDFWTEGIKRVKQINPDIIMLNEGGNIKYFNDFDIMYHIIDKSDIFETTSEDIADNKTNLKGYIPCMYQDVPENKFIICAFENHDIASNAGKQRVEVMFGSDGVDALLALCFTSNGIPFLYNGVEVADAAEKSMFWNRFYPGSHSVQWQNALTQKGRDRIAYIKELINLYRNNDTINKGKISALDIANKNIIAYQKEGAKSSVRIFINAVSAPQSINAFELSSAKTLLIKNALINNDTINFDSYGIVIIEN